MANYNFHNPITAETVNDFIADGKAGLIASMSSKIVRNQENEDFTLGWAKETSKGSGDFILKMGFISHEDIIETQKVFQIYAK